MPDPVYSASRRMLELEDRFSRATRVAVVLSIVWIELSAVRMCSVSPCIIISIKSPVLVYLVLCSFYSASVAFASENAWNSRRSRMLPGM